MADTAETLGEAAARAPAHLSAFFVPGPIERDHTRRGSKGAGVCLERGVAARVRIKRAEAQNIAVRRHPVDGPARVTAHALRLLLGNAALDVQADVTEEVPAEQGFGVSAASALSAALAAARALRLPRSDAVIAAHTADIQARAGLGDVAAQTIGGVVVRPAAGLPPYGAAFRVPVMGEVVTCVVGAPIETKGVLSDPTRMEKVRLAGEKALSDVVAAPRLERIISAGLVFARDSGVAPAAALEAAAACEGLGHASVAMIGSTVYAYGDTEALVEALGAWGRPEVHTISAGGAHVVTAS